MVEQLTMALSACEPQRPITTPLRAQRHYLTFDSRESALRWASRNSPQHIPKECNGVSAHPRPMRTSTGDWALVYSTCDIRSPRYVLTAKLALEPMR